MEREASPQSFSTTLVPVHLLTQFEAGGHSLSARHPGPVTGIRPSFMWSTLPECLLCAGAILGTGEATGNKNGPYSWDTESPEEETDDNGINRYIYKMSRAANKNKADIELGGHCFS